MSADDANVTALRYLRYDPSGPFPAGMNHQLSNLECLMREAHATGRLAVLPPLNLMAECNFGVPRAWSWDSYFDLRGSRLVDDAGAPHRLPVADSLPDAGVPTLTLAPGERMPPAAHAYALVVRRIGQGLFRRDVPAEDRPRIGVRIRGSARVRGLARAVVDDLTARGGGRFVAVHVRRGDRLGTYPRRLTEPERIRQHLRNHGVPDGAVVFVLSDERDPDFWEALERHYEVVRHTNYPRLVALVSGAGGRLPDNYLLYEVEKEVMRNAAMRIETLPGLGATDPHSTLVDERTWSRSRRRGRIRQAIIRLAGRALRAVGFAAGRARGVL